MFRNLIIYGLIFLTFPLTLLALSMTNPSSDEGIFNFANNHLLPEQFSIYTNGNGAINHPVPGYQKKILITNNEFKGMPGCYIACYSYNKSQAIYAIANNIFVYGQVRVPGRYNDRICTPLGFSGKDIAEDQRFKNLCNTKITTCTKNQCWAGGDTGGWFGINKNME